MLATFAVPAAMVDKVKDGVTVRIGVIFGRITPPLLQS